MMIGEEKLPSGYLGPEFYWWRRALARERLPTQDEALECGLYRWGNKRIAIWLDAGHKRAQVDGEDVWLEALVRNPQRPEINPWLYFCQSPVTPRAFDNAAKFGWPDNVIATTIISELSKKSNSPPDENSAADLLARLEEMAREAQKIIDRGPAKNQDEADVAAKIADALGMIQTTISDQHKKEKEPHLSAGRLVDAFWFPLRNRAEELKKSVKAFVLTPFLQADDLRRQKENAAMVSQGINPSEISGTTAKATGGTRTTALRTRSSAEVHNYQELWASLRDHPQVRALIQDIADRSAKAGIELPGMKIKRERIAV